MPILSIYSRSLASSVDPLSASAEYPMIALRGYKSIEKMNVKSRKKGSYGKHVVIPLSIARTDAIFLKQHGISFEGTIIREDHLFEYLYNSVGAFNLYFEESLDEVNQH